MPPESAYAALARDLKAAYGETRLGEASRRLTYERAGYRALLAKTARAVRGIDRQQAGWTEALTAIDARWGETATWAALRRASPPLADGPAAGLVAKIPNNADHQHVRPGGRYQAEWGPTDAIALPVGH